MKNFKSFAVLLLTFFSLAGCQLPEQDASTQVEQENTVPSQVEQISPAGSIEEAPSSGKDKEDPASSRISAPENPSPAMDNPSQSQQNVQKNESAQEQPQVQKSYVEITCYLDYAGNTQSQTITDPGTIQEIEGLFAHITESDLTMIPNTGGRFFIITIVNNGTEVSYRLARDRDADNHYYCKYADTAPNSSTGWLKLPNALAYQYFSNLFEYKEAPLGSPENPYAEEPQAEPDFGQSDLDYKNGHNGPALPDDEPKEV